MMVKTLLKRIQGLYCQQAQIERQIAEVECTIVAASKAPPKSRRRRGLAPQTVELVRETVRVLREAGRPLSRREIAAQVGIPLQAVDYRLQKALQARFVERVSLGRYRAAYVVPAF